MGSPQPSYCPPKLSKLRGIEEIRQRTPLTLEHKTPKIEPLYSRIWEGNQSERTIKGSHIYSAANPQEKGLENTPRNP
jgi:hypothetical protein